MKIEDRVKERQTLIKLCDCTKGKKVIVKIMVEKKSDEKKGNVSAEKKKVLAEEEKKCCQGKVKVAHLLQ